MKNNFVIILILTIIIFVITKIIRNFAAKLKISRTRLYIRYNKIIAKVVIIL